MSDILDDQNNIPKPKKIKGQLDLFSIMSNADSPKRRPAMKTPPRAESSTAADNEPPMPPLVPPSEVAHDVRDVFSDSVKRTHVSAPLRTDDGKPVLRTGVYVRSPKALSVPPAAAPSAAADRPAIVDETPEAAPIPDGLEWEELTWKFRLRLWWDSATIWFHRAEHSRVTWVALILIFILVGLWAFRSSRHTGDEEPVAAVESRTVSDADIESILLSAERMPAVEMPVSPSPSVATPVVQQEAPTAVVDAVVDLSPWKIAGVQASQQGGGAFLKFDAPVFVSSDRISPEGMTALKAIAKQLEALPGASVLVIGHTDDQPVSRPTERYKDNRELSLLRARTVVDHLAHMTRKNKAVLYDVQAGTARNAPYPNDSAKNRRLNRTATIHIKLNP